MTHMTATQMSNEATHMSKQDVETVKARTEIKEAIKEHRKTDDKNFRRMITGAAIALLRPMRIQRIMKSFLWGLRQQRH